MITIVCSFGHILRQDNTKESKSFNVNIYVVAGGNDKESKGQLQFTMDFNAFIKKN